MQGSEGSAEVHLEAAHSDEEQDKSDSWARVEASDVVDEEPGGFPPPPPLSPAGYDPVRNERALLQGLVLELTTSLDEQRELRARAEAELQALQGGPQLGSSQRRRDGLELGAAAVIVAVEATRRAAGSAVWLGAQLFSALFMAVLLVTGLAGWAALAVVRSAVAAARGACAAAVWLATGGQPEALGWWVPGGAADSRPAGAAFSAARRPVGAALRSRLRLAACLAAAALAAFLIGRRSSGTGPSTFIAPASPAATSISLVFENGTCSLPVSPTPDAPMPAGDAGGLPATSEPPAIGELAAAAPCRSLPPLPADAEPEPPTHPAEHAWMAPAEPAASRQLVVYGAWPGGIPPTGPASPAATSADGSFPGGMEPSGPAGPTPADVSDVPHTCGWVLGRRQPAGPAGPSPVDAEPAAAAQPAAASPAEPAASVKSTDPVGPPLPGVEAVSAAAFPQPAADFNAGPPATPGLTAADVGAEQASQPRAALPDTPVAGSDFDALVAEAKAAWAAMAQASGDASPAPISQDATDAPACTAAHIVTAVMRQAGSAADAAARAAARGVAAGLSKAGSAVGAAIRTAACSVVAGLGQGARAASAATCTAARSLSAALSEAGRAAGTASRTAARTLAAGISQAAHAAGAAARAIGHTLAAKLSQAGSVVRAAAGELVVASWHKMQAGRAWTSTQLATAGMHLRQWMLEAWASMRPDLPMALLHASVGGASFVFGYLAGTHWEAV